MIAPFLNYILDRQTFLFLEVVIQRSVYSNTRFRMFFIEIKQSINTDNDASVNYIITSLMEKSTSL